jgi:hypothetical protein
MAIQKVDNKKVALLASAQTLTGSYADIGDGTNGGPYINAMDCDSITLWLKITINSSTGLKVRMVGVNAEADTDLYRPVIKEVAAASVGVKPSEYAISNDASQNILLTFPVSDQIPLVKFQIMATVVGGTAAQVSACGVTFTSVV